MSGRAWQPCLAILDRRWLHTDSQAREEQLRNSPYTRIKLLHEDPVPDHRVVIKYSGGSAPPILHRQERRDVERKWVWGKLFGGGGELGVTNIECLDLANLAEFFKYILIKILEMLLDLLQIFPIVVHIGENECGEIVVRFWRWEQQSPWRQLPILKLVLEFHLSSKIHFTKCKRNVIEEKRYLRTLLTHTYQNLC
ncbi:Hypothetical predicted protein [Olea europaea subsp. europaea]|uniref:Uncharacterized protein n=1 Tax=Olea europaea subsp. europaea TaxID=158383 RepID=A0A8S0UBA4_OLEEU|nr:Hypothetical predicted protein [Olea europaea subsp. europaea]